MMRKILFVLLILIVSTFPLRPYNGCGAKRGVGLDNGDLGVEKNPVWYVEDNYVGNVHSQSCPSPTIIWMSQSVNLSMNIEIDDQNMYPGVARNVSINITNHENVTVGPIGIKMDLQYYIIVKDKKIVVENATGVFDVGYEYASIVYIGNISSNETVNISFAIIEAMGIEESRNITIDVFLGGEEIVRGKLPIVAHIPFEFGVTIYDRVLNITNRNHTEIGITINNIVPTTIPGGNYTIYNITVYIDVSPNQSAVPEYGQYVVEYLGNKENVSDERNITIWISAPELYEVSVYVRAEFAEIGGVDRVSHPGETIVRDIIIATTKKIIVFDEGHNQYYRFASEYMQGLIDLLRDYGPVLINRDTFMTSVLSPQLTGLVVIPVPEPEEENGPVFTDDEINALQKFVENGGNLILMGNWYKYFWPDNPNSYNELTGPYGLHWIDGDCYDQKNNFGSSWSVKAMNFANNSIARILTTGIEYVRFAGTALELKNATVSFSVEKYPIILGNNETYVTLGEETDEPIKNGSDIVMAAVLIINGTGKIFASGSSYMFSDYYYFSENKVFIENLIFWMFGAKKLEMEASPESYEYVGEPMTVNISIMNRGAVNITNVTLQVIVLSSELEYLNETPEFMMEVISPGETWTLKLMFKSSKAGEYYVQFELSAGDYETKIRRVVPLVFKEKPINKFLIGGILLAIVVIIVVFLYLKKLKTRQ